jgi:hypothetical protein
VAVDDVNNSTGEIKETEGERLIILRDERSGRDVYHVLEP